MDESVKKIRELALSNSAWLDFQVKDTPLETLKTIKFQIPVGSKVFNQQEICHQNLILDSQGCLGRVALAATIMEKHFPSTSLAFGEVWEDYLRSLMLETLQDDPSLKNDVSFMEELLLYEEPHAVLVVDGKQFDPLSLAFGQDIQHPRIQSFPLWEAIASSIMVSEAQLEKNPAERLKILESAEKLCPGLLMVIENMAEPLELLERNEEVIRKVEWILEKRPNARGFYVACLLTSDPLYCEEIKRIYNCNIGEIAEFF